MFAQTRLARIVIRLTLSDDSPRAKPRSPAAILRPLASKD